MSAEVIQLYEGGLTLRQVAARLGTNHMRIARALAEAGVPRRLPGRKRRDGPDERAKRYEAKRRADPVMYAKHLARIRDYGLRKNFAITSADYEVILASQGGLCAICGCAPSSIRLAVDHCHSTGRVRGLLCGYCNKGIGHFRDSPDVMAKAIAYVQRDVDHRTEFAAVSQHG